MAEVHDLVLCIIHKNTLKRTGFFFGLSVFLAEIWLFCVVRKRDLCNSYDFVSHRGSTAHALHFVDPTQAGMSYVDRQSCVATAARARPALAASRLGLFARGVFPIGTRVTWIS